MYIDILSEVMTCLFLERPVALMRILTFKYDIVFIEKVL